MNLHQLELLCAVIDRGSLTQASQDLYITPSAISIQIKRLEDTIGTPLVRRVKNSIIPTHAGRILYRCAKAAMGHLEMAQQQIQRLKMGAAGIITIGAAQTGALYRLADVLRDFGQQSPDLKVMVRVDSAERIVSDVMEGNVDLALEWMPEHADGLRVEPLLVDRFVLTLSPQHPLAAQSVVSVADFQQVPFVTLDYKANGPLDAALLRADIRPQAVMRLPSLDAVKRLVEANQGVSLLSETAIEREVAAGYLCKRTLAGFRFELDVVIIQCQGVPASPVVEDFVTFMKAHPRVTAANPNHRVSR